MIFLLWNFGYIDMIHFSCVSGTVQKPEYLKKYLLLGTIHQSLMIF